MDPGRNPTAGFSFQGWVLSVSINIWCTKRSGPYRYRCPTLASGHRTWYCIAVGLWLNLHPCSKIVYLQEFDINYLPRHSSLGPLFNESECIYMHTYILAPSKEDKLLPASLTSSSGQQALASHYDLPLINYRCVYECMCIFVHCISSRKCRSNSLRFGFLHFLGEGMAYFDGAYTCTYTSTSL